MQVMCSKECHDESYDFRCRRGNRLSGFTCPKCGAPMKRKASGPPAGSLGKRIVCAVCGKRRMSGGQFAKTLKYDCRLKGWDSEYYASVGRVEVGTNFPAGTVMCWCHEIEAVDPAVTERLRRQLNPFAETEAALDGLKQRVEDCQDHWSMKVT